MPIDWHKLWPHLDESLRSLAFAFCPRKDKDKAKTEADAGNSHGSVLAAARAVLAEVLHLGQNVDDDAEFTSLGADSLSMAEFTNKLNELLGGSLPAALKIEPAA